MTKSRPAAAPAPGSGLSGPQRSETGVATGAEERTATRLALLVLGTVLLFWSQVSEAAGARDPALVALAPARKAVEAFYVALSSGLGLTLMIAALLDLRPAAARRYALAVALFMMLLTDMSTLLVTIAYGSDNAAAGPYAAELLLRGEDPYRAYRLSDAVARYHMPASTITTTASGEAWEPLAYPAGSFLPLVPLVAAGAADLRPVFALCLVAMGLLLYARTPDRWKAPVLALLLVHHFLNLGLVALGLPDPMWGALVLLAIFQSRQAILAGALLGLAGSIKQFGALFIPFHAVYLARTEGWRSGVRSTAAGTAAFLIPNLPFLLHSPAEWMRGVVGTSFATLPAAGTGPAPFGALAFPDLPQALYTILALTALGAGLIWTARAGRVDRRLVWVLPLAPLWFAWRSYSSYFYLLPLFALAALIAHPDSAGQQQQPGGEPSPAPHA